MFIIFGTASEKKAIEYTKLMICSNCGQYGKYEVYVTYTAFTLFFISILKWNKHFYVRSTCCKTEYELDKEIGNRLLKGENIEITKSMLHRVSAEEPKKMSAEADGICKKCSHCGFETTEDYRYCPKCGDVLKG